MSGRSQLHRWRGEILIWTLAASVLVFWRPLFDNFALAKVTLVWVAAIAVTGLTVARWVVGGEVRIARSRFFIVVAAFLAALAVTTATSPSPATSFLGAYRRWTGLLSYAAYAALGLAVLRHSGRSYVARLLRSLVYVGLAVSLYALVQAAGLDPFSWSADDVPDVFSTLGNINFASSMVALTLPPALWHATRRDATTLGRGVGALALAVGAAALVAIGSLQGYVVAVAGLLMLVLGLAFERSVRANAALRQRRVQVLTLLLFLAAIVFPVIKWDTIVGQLGYGFRERLFFYDAAVAIFGDNPVLGTGLDTFGRFFTRYQPVAHALEYPEAVPDAPHSVPLGMFADGGLLLGFAYLIVVGYIGWRLLTGLRAYAGQERLLLVALGSVWLGYQLQSLISIDEPPLALLHWMTAGAIVGFVESPAEWTYRLSWGPVTTKKGKKVRRTTSLPPIARVGVGVIALGAITAAWLVTRPARADLAAAEGRGFGALAVDEPRAVRPAEAAFSRAHDLAPHNGVYWFEHARTRYARGDVEGALAAQEEAAALEPGQPLYAVNAAFYAQELGEQERASEWWNEAVLRDPRNPTRVTAAARFFETAGDLDKAAELRQRAEALMSAVSADSDDG